MADDYGLGTGIGVGLSKVGQALQGYADRKNQEREKLADKLEQNARGIAVNIMQAGGMNAPEAQPLIQQLYRTVNHHNALYKAHETPILIQRIQRFLGKQPAPPRADIRATMTPQQIMASTTLQTPTLGQQYSEIFGVMKRLHPNEDNEQIAARVETVLFPPRAATTRDRRYIMPDGTIRVAAYNDQATIDEIEQAGGQPLVFASQLRGRHSEDQIKNAAYMFANWGKIQPEYEVEVSEYLQNHPEMHVLDKNMVRAWGQDPDGRYYSFLVNKYTNQPDPGSKRYDTGLPPASYLPQIRPGVSFYVDANNQRRMVQYQETTQRQLPRDVGPGAAAGAAPQPPATPTAEPGQVPVPAPTPPAVPAAPTPQGAVTAPGAPAVAPPAAAPGAAAAAPAAAQAAPPPGGVTVTGDVAIGAEKLPAADEANVKQAQYVLAAGPKLLAEIQRFENQMGPLRGRLEQFKIDAGFYSELRRLQVDMQSFSALQPKFHGARGVSAIKLFDSISARISEDPRNAVQAIQGLMEQAKNILRANGKEYEDLPNRLEVQIPGQQPGWIDRSQFDDFFALYPNAQMIQQQQQQQPQAQQPQPQQ